MKKGALFRQEGGRKEIPEKKEVRILIVRRKNMKCVYLLGAGFTRAVYGEKVPLTDEIMSKIDLSQFSVLSLQEKQLPIEQLITLLDLKCLDPKQNKESIKTYNEIRQYITEKIIELFDYNNLSIDKSQNYSSLQQFIDRVPSQSTILSLNYDCILDQGLYQSGRWHPSAGYGFSAFFDKEEKNPDKIILLKLHGSCNFRNNKGSKRFPTIEISGSIFPNIGLNLNTRNSPCVLESHIIVMSYVKKFHNGIMYLWREAIKALYNAERLIIIGCALREEDTFLRFALYHFGTNPKTDKFFIDIIDKDKHSSNDIKQKIEKLVAYLDKQKITPYRCLEDYFQKN